MKHQSRILVAAAFAAAISGAVWAKATPEEVARLGKDLTCTGAEKAGNKEGTIPEFTGKYLGEVPGWKHVKYSGDRPTDPYANEKPVVTITAQNMAQYDAKLTDGQKVMFKKYPATFKINVYPGHRDYRFPDWVCAGVKKNALNGELVDGGLGLGPNTLGYIPFPFPKTGQEAVWNVSYPFRQYNYDYIADSFVVLPDGTKSKGSSNNIVLAPSNDPLKEPLVSTHPLSSHSWNQVYLPDSEKGTITVTQEGFNFKNTPRIGWSYNPGTRRVRQIPGTGFDQPLPGTNGSVIIDDVRLFNGSPERYSWKLLGKKEIYIPFNSFKLAGANVKYADLLKPGHENPDFIRYELRRVWVLEGNLKPEYRHIYSKRIMYIDEDTWHAVISDTYDGRGQLWKHNFLNYYYEPDTPAFWGAATFYHDLNSGKYTAADLTNEEKRGVIVMEPGKLKADKFTPEGIRAAGK